MDTLTQVRQQLDALLADLDQREQSVAQAAELLSRIRRRRRRLASRRPMGARSRSAAHRSPAGPAKRGGINAVVLTTLRRMVSEVEA
jgi:predicted aminopeptidase